VNGSSKCHLAIAHVDLDILIGVKNVPIENTFRYVIIYLANISVAIESYHMVQHDYKFISQSLPYYKELLTYLRGPPC
jgi:hypothetical protein